LKDYNFIIFSWRVISRRTLFVTGELPSLTLPPAGEFEIAAYTRDVLASQLPATAWHELIGESTIAEALLDRIVHSSHRIDFKGESKRKGMIGTIK
jgi:hypothetical protein